MRWGIMGLGAIAHEFADALSARQGICAVASRSLEKARAFQERFGASRAYGSYEEMLADPSVEAVYVATVNSRHLADARACLEAGKHVLCEKAIWGDYAELLGLCDLAAERGLVLAEAMTIFHMPLFKEVARMISDGELGRIRMVKADLGSLKEDDPENRFFNPALGGGAMLDIGTYALSFLRHFLGGGFAEVSCVTQPHATGVDEMWAIGVRTEEGVLGCANLAFRAKLPKRAIVAGDAAYVTIDNYVRADSATLVLPDGSTRELSCGTTADALAYEIADFERAVEEGDASGLFLDETLDVVRTMDLLLHERGYAG